MIRKSHTLSVSAAALCLQVVTASAQDADVTGKFYYILPDVETVRFEQFDRPAFEKAAAELMPNAQVEVLNSENNVQRQTSQVQAAIANGAKAILLITVDPKQAAGSLALAADAGIPVICMAHACHGGPAFAYLTAPFIEIGEKQAQKAAEVIEQHFSATGEPFRLAKIYGDPKFPFYTDQVKGIDPILDPLVEAGKLEVVCEADALLWLPPRAQTAMSQCIAKTDGQVDGIFAMNDDTGGAALAAVEAAEIGSVKLFGGYDASIAGVRRVAAGQQEMDMTVDYVGMNRLAVELSIMAAQGQTIPGDMIVTSYDNDYPGGLPEVHAINSVILPETIQEAVLDAGLYTREQLCGGIAVDTDLCKAN